MEYTIYAIRDMENSRHGFGYLCIVCQRRKKIMERQYEGK